MTTKEQNTVNDMCDILIELRRENAKFREDINLQVNSLKEKTDSKHMPIYLEQDILKSAQASIHESIIKCLTDYSSPLKKLTESVISDHSVQLRAIISESFNHVISQGEFKASIISAFSHKVARTIISNNDGLFDKVSNELKQDASFKAKMTLAVANVVNECLNK